MTGNTVDRRVRRTRTAIRHALITLMQEKGYDAVTVSDIIERADVGRSTFYAHYTDKRDVLHASLEGLGDFLRSHRTGAGELFAFSLPMFEHVHEQRALLRTLVGRRGGTEVQARLAHVIGELVREDLVALGGSPTVPLDLVVDCVVGAFTGLLTRWADDQDPRTPAQLDAAFRGLIEPGVRAAFRRPAAQRSTAPSSSS